MSQGGESRWLLVGNSRWHWAAEQQGERRYWSEDPGLPFPCQPERWAAVGSVPASLDPRRRLCSSQVPLLDAPTWLGVDRALAGYQAWCLSASPVLVADAGTALSLTCVDDQGRFAGGRLMAGASLQLRALHGQTAGLPRVNLLAPAPSAELDPLWPRQTEAAMLCGVLEGMAGALVRAARQLRRQHPDLQLWLTGGDGPRLAPLLHAPEDQAPVGSWRLDQGLCLDGLARVARLS